MSRLPLEAAVVDHAAGVEITRHAHAGGQLSLVLRGTMAVTSDEGWWLAPPGTAIWVAPKVIHGSHYSESSSLLLLRFSEKFAARLSDHCDTIVISDLLRELAREAVRLNSMGDQADTLELLAQLMVLQMQQPRHGPGLFVPHGRDRRLRQATNILRQNPGGDFNLDELAALAHTSARTLARLFLVETNMTFGRWREHLRIVCAIDKLARGQSITQTALELGYQSASSFTTLFTRLLGKPPRRYMQQLRQQDHATTQA